MNKYFTKKDFYIIIPIVLIIIVCFIIKNTSNDNAYIEVTINNKPYGEYSINDNQKININNENIIVIKNKNVYMQEATCNNQICVNQGKISKSGEQIICLPHKLVITIINSSSEGVDGIAS